MTKDASFVPLLKDILRELNIRYRFYWKKKSTVFLGRAMPNKNLIEIFLYSVGNLVETPTGHFRFTRKRITIQEFLSVFFHEVQHILAARRKLHKGFHEGFNPATRDKKKIKRWTSQLLTAERYCDKMGAKMMRKYFPEVPFVSSYMGEEGKQLIRELVNQIHLAYKIK